MATQHRTADDFHTLADDLRKRAEAHRLPVIESVPYGCGPGLPVVADTPQEGVRSVLTRDIVEMDSRLWTLICQAHIAPRRDANDYRELQRKLQQAADLAGTLSGRV